MMTIFKRNEMSKVRFTREHADWVNASDNRLALDYDGCKIHNLDNIIGCKIQGYSKVYEIVDGKKVIYTAINVDYDLLSNLEDDEAYDHYSRKWA